MWNEEEHPRDEIGRFTFKNGGGTNNSINNSINTQFKLSAQKNTHNETSYKGLFLNSEIQKEIEKQKQKRKEELLDILGNKATHGDVLYGDDESIKKKIKEYGLQPFKQDKEQHEILRQLTVYCYDNGHQSIPKGYERIGHFESRNNGFDSVVVKNDVKKQIVIAFRGMEIPSRDVSSVARIRFLNYTSQQKSAQAVYEKIRRDPKFKDYEIQTTGQSLGGYLAQYVAAKNNLKSATFNAYHGAKKALENEAAGNFSSGIIYPNNIVNYRNKEDPLSNGSTKNNLGLSLETDEKIRKKVLNKIEQSHMAENMGNLDNTRLKNQDYSNYATTKFGLINPIFLGKIKNSINKKLN